ncbi:pentatricopeptide repeat-containing protein [Phanerochaete sordida]|uniref:Pentatricopeptide repeat-containing protein n=1 Tax=Phanerochaete sordida TaxID=48140 RepID=A0A9P3G3P7_9APHY|nr:pentatricopeptide repeat-containing protein [Phanerochaete sordida]
MRSLIVARHLEEAERFWLEMHKLSGRTPPLVQAAIIEGFASSKNFTRARAVWRAFVSTKTPPAAVVYRAYLKALFLEGSAADAMAEFKLFEKELRKRPAHDSGDDPGRTSVFNVVLEWLVGQRRIDDARTLLDRMKKKGPQPDVTSFNMLLKHYRETKDVRAISGVMQELVALGMHGDVYTASVLLPAVLSVRTDAVHLVLALLRQSRTVVDLDTYYTLMNHLVRADEDAGFEAAVAVLDYMEADEPEYAPTGRVLGAVLEGVERRVWSNPKLAEHYRRVIMAKMYRRNGKGVVISERFTKKIILACCENPTSDGIHRAMVYYRKHMNLKKRTENSKLDGSLWTTFLSQLIRRSEWACVDELVRDFHESGVVLPESPIRNILLSLAQARNSNVTDYVEDNTEEWM